METERREVSWLGPGRKHVAHSDWETEENVTKGLFREDTGRVWGTRAVGPRGWWQCGAPVVPRPPKTRGECQQQDPGSGCMEGTLTEAVAFDRGTRQIHSDSEREPSYSHPKFLSSRSDLPVTP